MKQTACEVALVSDKSILCFPQHLLQTPVTKLVSAVSFNLELRQTMLYLSAASDSVCYPKELRKCDLTLWSLTPGTLSDLPAYLMPQLLQNCRDMIDFRQPRSRVIFWRGFAKDLSSTRNILATSLRMAQDHSTVGHQWFMHAKDMECRQVLIQVMKSDLRSVGFSR